MKRAGFLALCISGAAASVIVVPALYERPAQHETALGAIGDTALPSQSGLDRSTQSPEMGVRTELTPDVSLPNELAEPAIAHDAAGTAQRVEQGADDLYGVTGSVRRGEWTFEEEGYSYFSDSGTPLPFSGRGRVRFVPRWALDGRALIELPLPVEVPFSSGPVLRGEYMVDVFEPGFAPCLTELFDGPAGPAFECITSEGPSIELDVRLPDGSRPAHAFITFVPRSWSDARQLEARRDTRSIHGPYDYRREYFIWTAADPRMGLQVEEDKVVMDLLVLAVPFGDAPYDAQVASRYYSGVVRYDPAVSSPVRVQLDAAAHVSIEVARPRTIAIEVTPWVRAIRLDDGIGATASAVNGLDVEALLATSPATWPDALFEHREFHCIIASVDKSGRDEHRYVPPGRWRFATGWGDEPPTVVQEFDIALGWNEVVLSLGQPSTTGYIPVSFVAEEHNAPPDFEHLSYGLVTADPEGVESVSVEWTRGARGEGWLPRRALERLLAEAQGVRPLYLAGRYTPSGRPRIGFVSGPLHADMLELVLSEVPAARALLRVQCNDPGSFGLSVRSELLEVLTVEAGLMRIATRWPAILHAWVPFEPGKRLVPMPEALLPGRYRFTFDVIDAPLVALEPVELVLSPGQPEIPVEFPTLFEVAVHAPSLAAGVALGIRPRSEPDRVDGARAARDLATLDTDHRALFRRLPAGHYVITHGASHTPQNIVVPCGEVLYEPRRSDAFEVRLAPLDNGSEGALARAGFRTGDVLLDFNGRGLRDHDDLDALIEVIAENEATVRVRRGVHTLELRLGPMPEPGDPWATFDADFVPAWR